MQFVGWYLLELFFLLEHTRVAPHIQRSAKVVEGREEFARLDAGLRSQDGNLRFDVRLADVKPVDLKIALFSGADHARESMMRAVKWEDKN